MTGLIHVYCGDGKGKTTAALGQVMRACGNNMRVIYIQLMKTGTSGELKIIKKITGIEYIPCTKNFGFIKDMNSEEKKAACIYYQDFFEKVIDHVMKEKPDMFVIDEFMSAYNYNLINRERALWFLKNKPKKTEVIITGRDPADEITELADYVSEIKKIKHPFDSGIKARKGIEM